MLPRFVEVGSKKGDVTYPHGGDKFNFRNSGTMPSERLALSR